MGFIIALQISRKNLLAHKHFISLILLLGQIGNKIAESTVLHNLLSYETNDCYATISKKKSLAFYFLLAKSASTVHVCINVTK